MSHAAISNLTSRIVRFAFLAAVILGVSLAPRLGWAQDGTVVAADGSRPVDRHPLFTFDIRLGYDSNVNSTYNDKLGSGFVNFGGGVTYTASSPRSTLTLGAGAGISYYFESRAQ